jgi:hypothetical protein
MMAYLVHQVKVSAAPKEPISQVIPGATIVMKAAHTVLISLVNANTVAIKAIS